MKLRYIFLLLCMLPLLAVPVTAHPGDIDSSGGHYDSETGKYHYHHSYPAHDHADTDGDGDLDCPYNFAYCYDGTSYDFSQDKQTNSTTPSRSLEQVVIDHLKKKAEQGAAELEATKLETEDPQESKGSVFMNNITTIIYICLCTIAFIGGIFLYSRCGRPLATTKKCLTPAAIACHACLDLPVLAKSFEAAIKRYRYAVTVTFVVVLLLLGIFGLLSLSLGYFLCFLVYRSRITFENDMMAKSTLSVLLDFVLPDKEDEFVEEYTDFVFAQITGYNWKVSKWRSRD